MEIKPYDKQFFAMVPKKGVLFFRTCVIYQLYRFVVINLKMLSMIRMSHH